MDKIIFFETNECQVRKLILIFSIVLFLIGYTSDGYSISENFSVCLLIYFFLDFLSNLGKKIVILDLTIIMAVLTCLVMPVIFYHVYTRANPLARLWVKYMPVNSDDYFAFALPAVLLLTLGLKVPLGRLKVNKSPELYIERVKEYLNRRPNLGLTLVLTGFICGLLDFLSPDNLKEVFYLAAHLTHVGVFYVIYSPNKRKSLIVAGVILLVIGQSILTGMFGELVFMLACAMILVLLGKKIPFWRKLVLAVAGIFLIIIIQSVKRDYRDKSWKHGGADAVYFAQLIGDRVTNLSSVLDPNIMFVTSVRMNQGWLVAETMYQVPDRHPFAHGETIWQSIAATIVPRFLWPDKPEAGGKANLKRFWGFNLVGWSTNIGPLGEAYANFDRVGGVIYMLFYGLFFNLVLSLILKAAERRPSIILWIPFLFFNVVTVESDLLTTMGALLKGLFFTWLVFKIFHSALRIDL
jgi:hypothetical protein